MKRIHYLLLGLLVSLTIAAVSPTMPPTRIAPGTGLTVVTNGINSFTLASSGILTSNGLATNLTVYSSGTTNRPLRVFSTNGEAVYVDKDGVLFATNSNNSIAGYLPLAGGTMTGQLNISGGNLTVGKGLFAGAPQITDNPLVAGATTINVSSTTGFASSGYLILDMYTQSTVNEIVSYTGITATAFTGVVRGLYGTTDQNHVVSRYFAQLNILAGASSNSTANFASFNWNSKSHIISGVSGSLGVAVGDGGGIQLGGDGRFTGSGFYVTSGGYFSAIAGISIYVRAPSASETINIGDNNAAKVILAEGGGKVGIGTTSPTAKLHVAGDLSLSKTITAVGTTGNQTINMAMGRVNIAAAGTSVVVTNSLATTNSIIVAVAATADATARVTSVVAGAGSFTINTAATTAETAFNFILLN